MLSNEGFEEEPDTIIATTQPASNNDSVKPYEENLSIGKLTKYHYLMKQYKVNDFFVLLNNDGYYTITDIEQQDFFTGPYNIYPLKEAIDKKLVSKADVNNSGLNYYQIDKNNLYFVVADYDIHVFDNNQEYYQNEIFGENNFKFFIYIKTNDNKTQEIAMHSLNGEVDNLVLSKSYF